MSETEHEAPEPEPDAVAAGKTMLVIVASLVVCGGAVLCAAWLYGLDSSAAGSPAPVQPGAVPVSPRAPGGLEQTLVEHVASGVSARASGLEELNRYGLIDRTRGIYAIPIDRAMDLLASRGGVR
jgi:hypothetical protein